MQKHLNTRPKTNMLITILCFVFAGLQSSATETDTTQIIEIGGIKQYISISGEAPGKPVLFYLHGGPGTAVSAHKDFVTGELEKYFTVVHWDQRGSGKTLQLNETTAAPTFDQMKKDAEELLNFICNRFTTNKIIVLGNSWGTLPAFHLAQRYPEKIRALIAVSPVVSNQRSQQTTLELLQHYFEKQENSKAIQQLSDVNIPYSGAKEMLIQYRWESEYNGEEMSDEQFDKLLHYFQDWEKMWFPLYCELYKNDLERSAGSIKCPVYFIVGKKDLTTYFTITEAYFHKLKAPEKQLFWMEDVGHNIPGVAAGKMQKTIIEYIVPLLNLSETIK
nr:alpha/beta hydrolase [uncultured Draconibacterium sp.]